MIKYLCKTITDIYRMSVPQDRHWFGLAIDNTFLFVYNTL